MAVPNGDSVPLKKPPAPTPDPGKYRYWPVDTKYKLSQTFDNHKYAVDIDTKTGDPIIAPTGMTIIDAGWATSGYGWYVKGKDADGNIIILAHMVKEPDVKTGQVVNAGTFLGYSGSSGNSSGDHLHYEIRTAGGGGYIDPASMYGENLYYPGAGPVANYEPSGAVAFPPGTGKTPQEAAEIIGRANTRTPQTAASNIMKGLVDWTPLLDFVNDIEWQNIFTLIVGIALVLIGVSTFVKAEGASTVVKLAKELL